MTTLKYLVIGSYQNRRDRMILKEKVDKWDIIQFKQQKKMSLRGQSNSPTGRVLALHKAIPARFNPQDPIWSPEPSKVIFEHKARSKPKHR